MSAGDDNVFARWSRRKLAARQNGPVEKAPGPTTPGPEAGASAQPADAEPVDGEPANAEPAEAQPADAEPVEAEPAAAVGAETPEALPRLEDLHADSDLSAFLRKGVPAALKNSALRKMWSLDPVIRDHVGPAEYAWDFNTPGSMAGFGPLEANSAVVDFLSTVGRSVLSDKEDMPTATEVPAAEQPGGPDNALPSDRQESAETIPTEAAAPDAPATAEPTLVQYGPPGAAADGEGTSSEEPESSESAPEPVRPRHGGAVPR